MLTFTVEVLLKGEQYAVSREVEYDGPEPARWTEDDVRRVLKAALATLDQVERPEALEPRPVGLRGLSWIVTPYADGVAIAIEIGSGAVVAGPFAIDGERLTALIERALRESAQRAH
jgi:hypothetical protein